jgi:hypothetical protein
MFVIDENKQTRWINFQNQIAPDLWPRAMILFMYVYGTSE